MGDSRPPWRERCGSFRVHMDELVILGALSEQIDPILSDLQPVPHSLFNTQRRGKQLMGFSALLSSSLTWRSSSRACVPRHPEPTRKLAVQPKSGRLSLPQTSCRERP